MKLQVGRQHPALQKPPVLLQASIDGYDGSPDPSYRARHTEDYRGSVRIVTRIRANNKGTIDFFDDSMTKDCSVKKIIARCEEKHPPDGTVPDAWSNWWSVRGS
jgi:hypothetical protein